MGKWPNLFNIEIFYVSVRLLYSSLVFSTGLNCFIMRAFKVINFVSTFEVAKTLTCLSKLSVFVKGERHWFICPLMTPLFPWCSQTAVIADLWSWHCCSHIQEVDFVNNSAVEHLMDCRLKREQKDLAFLVYLMTLTPHAKSAW